MQFDLLYYYFLRPAGCFWAVFLNTKKQTFKRIIKSITVCIIEVNMSLFCITRWLKKPFKCVSEGVLTVLLLVLSVIVKSKFIPEHQKHRLGDSNWLQFPSELKHTLFRISKNPMLSHMGSTLTLSEFQFLLLKKPQLQKFR